MEVLVPVPLFWALPLTWQNSLTSLCTSVSLFGKWNNKNLPELFCVTSIFCTKCCGLPSLPHILRNWLHFDSDKKGLTRSIRPMALKAKESETGSRISRCKVEHIGTETMGGAGTSGDSTFGTPFSNNHPPSTLEDYIFRSAGHGWSCISHSAAVTSDNRTRGFWEDP